MLPLQPKQLLSLFRHTFDWIQVEVTSHCNALCVYCPRTVFKESWQDRHLSLETFKKLKPVLIANRPCAPSGLGRAFSEPGVFRNGGLCETGRMQSRDNDQCDAPQRGNCKESDRKRSWISSLFLWPAPRRATIVIRKGTSLKKVLKAIETLSREKEQKGKIDAGDSRGLYALSLGHERTGGITRVAGRPWCQPGGDQHAGLCADR